MVTRASHVACSKIIGMRNVLVHEYFGIDLDVVWDTAVSDLPPLRRAVEELLTGEEDA